jgi:hypothetical protein
VVSQWTTGDAREVGTVETPGRKYRDHGLTVRVMAHTGDGPALRVVSKE